MSGTPSHHLARPCRAALALLAAAHLATAAHAEDAPPPGDAAPASPYTFTGHVDAVSRYVLRGATSTYGNGAPLGNAGATRPSRRGPRSSGERTWPMKAAGASATGHR